MSSTIRGSTEIKIVPVKDGLKLSLPKSYAFLIPRAVDFPDLKPVQRRILRLLRRVGTLSMQTIQERCKLTRSAARREIGGLVEYGLVETVRDGRGQAFRLI